MYKVVRMERQDDSVFRDDFQFAGRKEAESFYSCERFRIFTLVMGVVQ